MPLSIIVSYIRKHINKLTLVLGIGMILGGLYLIILIRSPVSLGNVELYTEQQLASIDHKIDKVIIPKIGVNIAYNAGDDQTLEKGAWWRYPERGNPVDGGNFILSAHRFSIGITPGQTRTKSPFYHVDKLKVGDQILIDYKNKRYEYKITKKYRVEPTQIDIEAKTEQARLTLYSCTLKGSQDGREVIEAIIP